MYLAVNIAFTALAAIFFTLFITTVKDMDVATMVHAFLSDPIGWISAWAEKVLTP
jgi:hypothetical protein